jgi:hypothetical protein
MKQQVEEQAKVVAPAVCKKVASIITVKTTPPQQQVPCSVDMPQALKTEADIPQRSDLPVNHTQRFHFKPDSVNEKIVEPEPQVVEAPIQPQVVEAPVQIELPIKVTENVQPSIVEEIKQDEDTFDSPLVHYLLSMGFDKASINKAVNKYYDMESALEYLLGDN